MSLVVSDASPIRALTHLGLLPLLRELYGEVAIPAAVFRELTRRGRYFEPLTGEQLALFLVRDPTTSLSTTVEFDELDAGERDAIRLAIEISVDGLLIDESLGRRVARRLGVRITGTLGVLSQAKHRGSIPAVGPLMERLQTEINFFIAPALKRTILTDLGEWPSLK